MSNQIRKYTVRDCAVVARPANKQEAAIEASTLLGREVKPTDCFRATSDTLIIVAGLNKKAVNVSRYFLHDVNDTDVIKGDWYVLIDA